MAEGKYVRLVASGRWEWAERVNTSGAVVIVPVTSDQELVLIEQYRLLGGNPAGISPKPKKSDKDDMPNDGSAKTATLPGGGTGPNEANAPEEPTKEGENGSK